MLLTPATNLADVVQEYGAGVVVEGTTEAVCEGIAGILEASADRYASMCLAAQRLASERFTWPKVAEQVAAAYHTILG